MVSNLFSDIPSQLPDESSQTLLAAPQLRIERIVSDGHASPDGFWFDQAQHEWVLLVQGSAILRFEDETVKLKPGDYIHIPAHKRHRIEQTDTARHTIWLAIHYGDPA